MLKSVNECGYVCVCVKRVSFFCFKFSKLFCFVLSTQSLSSFLLSITLIDCRAQKKRKIERERERVPGRDTAFIRKYYNVGENAFAVLFSVK